MNSSEILFYTSITLQALMASVCVYFLIISLSGWSSRKKDQIGSYEPSKTFALVVAAHNEERVIGHIVENLSKLKYPREMYDIFVIADNCTDSTAAIAREGGALVYERTEKIKKGKGYALQWMFDKIFQMDKKYDAIAVFDADNLASSNFLTKMNDMLCSGHKVVQAYLDVKNPYDSWVTLANSMLYWMTNKLFNQARHNLNMWCTIGGTGFCISTDVLKQIPWDATCLTEDLEYTVKLVLNDIRIAWCSDASVYDEKPITFMQSWNQRKRWMQGHADVFSRFFLKLLKKGIKERSLTAIDLAIYNSQPLYIVLTFFASIVMYLVSRGFHSYSVEEVRQLGLLQPWAITFVLGFIKVLPTVFVYILPIIALITEKRFNFKVLLGFPLFLIFSLSWIPVIVLGFINKNKKEWNHTLHTREITINELEQA